MKLGIKLISGFLAVALLVGFVGIFGVISNNTLQENNEIGMEVAEMMNLLDHSLIEILKLITTENLDDYYADKSEIEDFRKEYGVLHEKLHEENEEELLELGFDLETFHQNVGEFTRISNKIIATHQEGLVRDREFDEKKSLEKEKRLAIRDAIWLTNNVELYKLIDRVGVHSKAALYQYKNKEYVDKWLKDIQNLKAGITTAAFTEEEKASIQNDINTYERTARDLGEIVIEQKKVETQETLAAEELRELINLFEEEGERISSIVVLRSESLARTTRSIMLVVSMVIFILSVVLGLFLSRSISNPLTKLKESADKISKGNLGEPVEVKTQDEIGELAESFDNMRYSLKMVIDEYEKMKGIGGKVEKKRKKVKKEETPGYDNSVPYSEVEKEEEKKKK